MGIQSASATFTRFHVPDIAVEDFWSFMDEKIQEGVFKDLDEGQEIATGFSSWDDFFDTTFDGSYHKGEYVAFNYRLDQRRVPAIVKKQHVREAIQKYRDENGGKWPSRHERQEIQENVENWLLNRAFPQPSSCEVVWNPAAGWMFLGTTSSKMMESFLEHFEKHFHVYPVPLYHIHWALNTVPLDARQKDTLNSMVVVQSPQALDEGRFLGYEFLTWLWFFTEHGSGRIKLGEGKEAEIHIGERLVLTLPGEGKEKVVCTTQANFLHEAREALRQGKYVNELKLLLIVGDNEYTLTLDSALWAVKGLKTPKQFKDYDEEDQDSLFLEKMFFLEEVSEVLNTLYGAYLNERLSAAWESDVLPKVKAWIGSKEKGDGEDGQDSAPF
ncbi:MAG: recombination-associated protein RdgC [Acidobacteriota bacterium]